MDEAKITLSSRLSQQLKELSVQEKISPEDVLEAALLTFRQARQAKQLACKAQAAFKPQLHLREAPLDPSKAALLYIDIQNYNCHPDGALYDGNAQDTTYEYWWQRMEAAKVLWRRLLEACRAAQMEVMYTVMQSLTDDGRDRSLDYKISGFHIPRGSWDGEVRTLRARKKPSANVSHDLSSRSTSPAPAKEPRDFKNPPEVLDCIRPQADDIVICKTSSSVFTTTNIDTLLRNLDRKQLVIAGCLTDQCIESAVRDACDLNYICTMVTDGCCTYSQARHQNSLAAIKGYCRQRTVQEIIEELQ